MRILHVVSRLAVGGLESGLVNIVNGLRGDIDHLILSLTDHDDIVERIFNERVRLVCLHKPPGIDPRYLLRVRDVVNSFQPDVMHTRNTGTLETQLLGLFARVPLRIHGEHGWDVQDPDGKSWKYRLLRHAFYPLLHRWVAVSQEIESWLLNDLGFNKRRVWRICNGVDTDRFKPNFSRAGDCVNFVTVSRLNAVKNPKNTLDAFLLICERCARETLTLPRLTIVGDGPLMQTLKAHAQNHKFADRVCFAGKQAAVSPFLADADAFVLGSSREGISNTILEAMASGLPCVVTCVGGNPELIQENVNGFLVEADNVEAMSEGMYKILLLDLQRLHEMGDASRSRAVQAFSINKMLDNYGALYRSSSKLRNED